MGLVKILDKFQVRRIELEILCLDSTIGKICLVVPWVLKHQTIGVQCLVSQETLLMIPRILITNLLLCLQAVSVLS